MRRLARRAEREQDAAAEGRAARFIAEGEDLLAAADAAGWPALDRLVAAGSGLPGTEVEPELLAKASSLGSGTRAIGIYAQRWAPRPAGPLAVALWGVGDPGNVGTVLRSALAFGATSVALGPDTANPFSPKAVRASMGAIFSVPVSRVSDPPELPRPTIALVARAGEALRGPIDVGTLVIGAEREGLPEDVVAACERIAHIPTTRESESLNAAMAATVALYEAARRVS